MNAMTLHEVGPIESSPLKWSDVPDPRPGPGEIRLRVRCCGICRTDLHVIEGDLSPHTLPIIPGHQIVGVVDAVGEGCDENRVGQRVGVAWLRHTCGQCRYCRSERENLCETSRFTGYHADGGYAELAVVPEAFAYPLPDVFDDAEVSPLLCAGIIGYRALKRCNLRPGSTLALYGFGSSAHVVLQIARRRGHDVYVVSRTSAHQELARELGAAWVGGRAVDLPAAVDSAIVFAPAGPLVTGALEMLRKGGTLALAGIHMSDVPALNYEKHLFYERDVRSVTANTRIDARELLAEAARSAVRPHILRYALEEANRALHDLKAGRIRGAGVLVV